MEREEANTILHKMSKVIDNNQMVMGLSISNSMLLA